MKRKRSVAAVLWLPTAVVVAGLAWVWWHSRANPDQAAKVVRPSAPAPPLVQPAKLETNAPRVSVPRTEATRPATEAPTLSTNTPLSSSTNLVFGKPKRQPFGLTNSIAGGLALTNYPRAVQTVVELQAALARQVISPGSLDGFFGAQTRVALKSFQQKEHLPTTGELDTATRALLVLTNPVLVTYVITSNDLARLQPLSPTWLGKSQQSTLDYESVLELIAERGHASPSLIKRLNPSLDWTNIVAGTSVQIPEVSAPQPAAHAAFLTIQLEDKVLEGWDENTNLLAHFPCSIARRVEKRPVGELHVAVIAQNPNYTLDPENFPESAEARELKTKLILPPGPNNPVGVAWIGLDKPGYGIHGTPNPEQVGRTESHGCFRLANWNAEYLMHLVSVGTPVYIQP